MTVYLLRHGQTAETELDYDQPVSLAEFNRLLQDSPTIPLLEVGKPRIQAQAQRLRHLQIQRIYASPFRRTCETADLVAAELGLPVHICEDLREVVPQYLHANTDRRYTYRQLLVRAFLAVALDRPGSGENLWQCWQRAMRIWERVAVDLGPEENILLVSHQGIARMLLAYLTTQLQWSIAEVDLSPAGLTVIRPRPLRLMGE